MNSVKSADGTTIAVDRTGTGPVGDVTVEREIEDFAAVVAQTGEMPFAFGDSLGGATAIAAAAAGVEVRKVATYEVPFTQGPSFEFADQLAALVGNSSHRRQAVQRRPHPTRPAGQGPGSPPGHRR